MDPTILPQLILTGIIYGAPLAVLGLGMSLILAVARRFHFALAFTFTLAAFVAAVLATRLHWPVWAAIGVAIVASALASALIEILIYRPLVKGPSEDAGLLPVFVSALGVTIAGESAIQLLWTRESPTIPLNIMKSSAIELGPNLRLTTFDLLSFGIFTLLAIAGILVLRYTRVGQIVRGVRGNRTMARAVGIRPDAVNTGIFLIAGATSGLVACFAAARYSAAPAMGFDPLFTSFVVAFLAGTNAPALRVVLIAFGLAVIQSVASLFLPATLTDIVVFGLLFVYLAIKGTDLLLLFPQRARRI